tara:strand:+ start:4224 stop:4811 length:588 start_codon:yes stop_codon:yes gene_type:complete
MSYLTHNENKYYFLHIPKTGGSTVRVLLRPLDSWREIYHEPLSKKPEAYTFTTIRNPLDRLVSAFFYLSRGGINKSDKADSERFSISDSFDNFVHRLTSNPKHYFKQQHLRPMIEYINDVKYIDRFMVFDDLEREIISLYKMITGKDLKKIPHRNKSKHKYFETYYTKKTKALVESVYSEDLKLYQKALFDAACY